MFHSYVSLPEAIQVNIDTGNPGFCHDVWDVVPLPSDHLLEFANWKPWPIEFGDLPPIIVIFHNCVNYQIVNVRILQFWDSRAGQDTTIN